jgi:hypothetical protein
MNVMERAGNDPRLDSLDPLIRKSDNENINKLMEREVGYIKNISHNTLYESDYILVYTTDINRVDSLIGDTIECIYKILNGAYVGYRILNSKEIVEFVKDEYGVQYFNYTQAILDMQKINGAASTTPFTLSRLVYDDGESQILESVDINRINTLTSEILSGTKEQKDVSFREALVKKKVKENIKIDFDDLETGYVAPVSNRKPKAKNNKQNRNNQNKSAFDDKSQGFEQDNTSIFDDDPNEYYQNDQEYYNSQDGYYDNGQGYYQEDQGYYPEDQGYYQEDQGYYDDGYGEPGMYQNEDDIDF